MTIPSAENLRKSTSVLRQKQRKDFAPIVKKFLNEDFLPSVLKSLSYQLYFVFPYEVPKEDAERKIFLQLLHEKLTPLGYQVPLELDKIIPECFLVSWKSNSQAPDTNKNSEKVTEMALCEIDRVCLRPNQLYRFKIMPGCKECEKCNVYA
jgi:hypothetical protein